MREYPEIFVLRHGQTVWNREGRFQGRMDSELTDLGRNQAKNQGRILESALKDRNGIRAFTSPQLRAVQTASLALGEIRLEPTVDARLCEIGFGQWEGLTFEEIAGGWPIRSQYADTDPFGWQFQAPGGETFEAIVERSQEFLDCLTGPCVVITHGITSRIIRGLWLNGDWDDMAALAGGQGCVYHLNEGAQNRLD